MKLSDPTKYEVIAAAFAGRPGVEQVQDQRQLLDRFFRLLNGLQVIALSVAVAMLVVTACSSSTRSGWPHTPGAGRSGSCSWSVPATS